MASPWGPPAMLPSFLFVGVSFAGLPTYLPIYLGIYLSWQGVASPGGGACSEYVNRWYICCRLLRARECYSASLSSWRAIDQRPCVSPCLFVVPELGSFLSCSVPAPTVTWTSLLVSVYVTHPGVMRADRGQAQVAFVRARVVQDGSRPLRLIAGIPDHPVLSVWAGQSRLQQVDWPFLVGFQVRCHTCPLYF